MHLGSHEKTTLQNLRRRPVEKKTRECARTWTKGLRLQQLLFAARTHHTLFASRPLGARPGNSALVSLRFLYSRMDLGQHVLVNRF